MGHFFRSNVFRAKVSNLCTAKDLEKSKNGLDYSVTLVSEREREKKGGLKECSKLATVALFLYP